MSGELIRFNAASDLADRPRPVSITSLTCGCTLLIAGSVCDALGAKPMYLLGTVLQTAFVLGCALARNGADMVIFRGLTGVAISLCLPSAVSIITSSFVGNQRNMAFACLGAGQPVGFAVGLVLGGFLTQAVTWRLGFYIGAAIIGANVILIIWAVPSDASSKLSWAQKRQQLVNDIDWVGAALASTSLAMSSYVFASITGSARSIRSPTALVPLIIAFALVPVFVFWVGRQERLSRPAIIPNSLWRNRYFTTICIAVFLAWGTFNSIETLLTLYFQDVQLLSPLQTSYRFLPAAIMGLVSNLVAGALVHRISAHLLVSVGLFITCAAPLTVAIVATPSSSYWSSGFVANALSAIGVDALFTTANLLISSVFPARTQALAGGVFNTVSQIGKSVGVALTAIVAASVTANLKAGEGDEESLSTPPELLEGYKAAFWFCFALSGTTLLVTLWGLRGIGRVGHKRD